MGLQSQTQLKLTKQQQQHAYVYIYIYDVDCFRNVFIEFVTVFLLFYGLCFWLQVLETLGGAVVKNLPGNAKDQVHSLGRD